MSWEQTGRKALAGAFLAPAIGVLILVSLADTTPTLNASTFMRAAVAYYALALVWLGPVAGFAIYGALAGAAAVRGRISPVAISLLLGVVGGVVGLGLGAYFGAGGAPLPYGERWWNPQDFRVAGLATGVMCGLGCAAVHARTKAG